MVFVFVRQHNANRMAVLIRYAFQVIAFGFFPEAVKALRDFKCLKQRSMW
jgi:hypothetical protein